jgi:phosphoglycerate dehydrogenase-like enzyme
MNAPEEIFRIHFETRSNKPDVFRFTEELVTNAMTRNGYARDGAVTATTLGSDLSDLSWLSDAQVLVTSNDVIVDPRFPRQALAERAPRLKWIHIIGAGIEPLLPLEWLPQQVVLTNNSGVHFDKAVESATMILLMLNARMPEIVGNQHRCVWDQIFTPTIRSKTALVIGVGDMGAAAAAAARSLGLTVLGIRRSGRPHELVDEMFSIGELDMVLPRADFVVLAAPLTSETVNLMNNRRFGLMKRGAAFFNFGRAGSVDHHALIESLNDRRLSGAVIDVVDKEPLDPDSPLWSTKNLIIMPHVSSDDLDLYLPKTFDLVFQNLERLRTGQPLLNFVDRLKQY